MREQLNGLNFTQPTKIQRIQLQFQSQKHPFRILDVSPYPFLVSFFLLALLTPVTLYMHGVDVAVFAVVFVRATLPQLPSRGLEHRPFTTTSSQVVVPDVLVPPPERFAWTGNLWELVLGCLVTGIASLLTAIPFIGSWLAILLLFVYSVWRFFKYRHAVVRVRKIERDAGAVHTDLQKAQRQILCAMDQQKAVMAEAESRLRVAEARLRTMQDDAIAFKVAKDEVAVSKESFAIAKRTYQSLGADYDAISQRRNVIDALVIRERSRV